MTTRIALVEDEPNMVRTLAKILERRGFEVATAANGKEALTLLDAAPADVLITDLNMPVMDGMALLRELKDRPDRPATIVLTGYGTIQSAVEAMKLGAADYLIKPCNPDELLIVVERQIELRDLRREVATLRREVRRHQKYGALIGESPAMQELYRTLEAVSQNKSTVLVTGASGTGKELVARTLHAKSPWSRGPFVALNCGAVAETLLDSQLFGHRRGAFTGAIGDQEGVFQAAHGGTLFLDEVSEIPSALQVKFLRAIQEREVVPIGSTRPVKVDVRLVAATNRGLRDEVRAGRFREDLFYRLNVVNIDLPPLSARPADIPLLVRHFVEEFAKSYRIAAKEISPEAMARLTAYPWPGNVRELQNAIERAFAMSREPVVDLEDVAIALERHEPIWPAALPPAEAPAAFAADGAASRLDGHSAGAGQASPGAAVAPPAPAPTPAPAEETLTLEAAERRAISTAFARAGGNKNEAARLLGIDRQRLYRKLEKYQIR